MEENRFEPLRLPSSIVVCSLKDISSFLQIHEVLTEELGRLCMEKLRCKTNMPNSNAWMITVLFKAGVFRPAFLRRLRSLREYVDLGLALELETEGLEFLQDEARSILNILRDIQIQQ